MVELKSVVTLVHLHSSYAFLMDEESVAVKIREVPEKRNNISCMMTEIENEIAILGNAT